MTIRATVACRESRKWQLHSKVRCGKMEWMCVNGRFQNRRFTSQKGGEAGPAAPRPSSAQTS